MPDGPGTLLQPWLCERPWAQQSMVVSAIRGPEDPRARAVKAMVKWLRRVSLRQAVEGHDFMRVAALPRWQDVVGELEWLSGHYAGHLHKAMCVVVLGHPDPVVVAEAARLVWGIPAGLGFRPVGLLEWDGAHQDATTIEGEASRGDGVDRERRDRAMFLEGALARTTENEEVRSG